MNRFLLSIFFLCLFLLGIVYLLFWPAHKLFIGIFFGFEVCLGLLIILKLRSSFDKEMYLRDLRKTFDVFLIFCIFSLLNFIAFKLDVRFDLTKNQINSLSKQSHEVLKNINTTTDFFFVGTKEQEHKYLSLLKLYLRENHFLKLKVLDPYDDVKEVRGLDIQKVPTLVIKNERKSFHLSQNINEREITHFLSKSLSDSSRTFCYLPQSSIVLSDQSNEGASRIVKHFQSLDYQLVEFNFNKEQECDLFLLWGVKKDFSKEEIKKLSLYIKSKPLFFIFEPELESSSIVLSNFMYFLKKNELSAPNNVVLDAKLSKDLGDSSLLIFSRGELKNIILSFSRSFDFKGKGEVILQSSDAPYSWGETDFTSLLSGELKFTDQDLKGPRMLMGKKENLLFLGTPSLVQNKSYRYPDNFLFITKNIKELIGDTSLAIASKNLAPEEFMFKTTELQIYLYFLLFFFPLIICLYFIFQKIKVRN